MHTAPSSEQLDCKKERGKCKDFQAFRVGLVRRLTSAEFAFLFMVSNPYVLQILILITLKAKIFRTYDFKHEQIENSKKKKFEKSSFNKVLLIRSHLCSPIIVHNTQLELRLPSTQYSISMNRNARVITAVAAVRCLTRAAQKSLVLTTKLLEDRKF